MEAASSKVQHSSQRVNKGEEGTTQAIQLIDIEIRLMGRPKPFLSQQYFESILKQNHKQFEQRQELVVRPPPASTRQFVSSRHRIIRLIQKHVFIVGNIIEMEIDIEQVGSQRSLIDQFDIGIYADRNQGEVEVIGKIEQQSKSSMNDTQCIPPRLIFDEEEEDKIVPVPSSPEEDEELFKGIVQEILGDAVEESSYEGSMIPQPEDKIFEVETRQLPSPVIVRVPPRKPAAEYQRLAEARRALRVSEEPDELYRYRQPQASADGVQNNYRTRIWNHLNQVLPKTGQSSFTQVLGDKRQLKTNNLVRFSACFASPLLRPECQRFFLQFAPWSIFTSSKASYESKRNMLRHLGVFTQGAKKGYIENMNISRRA